MYGTIEQTMGSDPTFIRSKILNVESIVKSFDEFLAKNSLKFESIVIGGAALIIMGVIQRETVDIDCLDPKIPEEILNAAQEFRKSNPNLSLSESWINNGPDSLVKDLPKGWRHRIVPLYNGNAITFYTLGRLDLLMTKLFAFCDRDIDLNDCLRLKPTVHELEQCFSWVVNQDANPHWSKNVENHFRFLKKELGYGES